MRLGLFHLIVFSFVLNPICGQTIVNTETLMAQNDSGLVWTAGVGGDLSKGNSNVLDVSIDGGATWMRGRHGWKLIASYNQLAQDGETIQGNAFGHLHWDVGDALRFQFFGFAQTSANNVLLLNQRSLFGIGGKRRLITADKGWLALSYGCFWEHESYDAEAVEPDRQLLRSSAIISAQFNPSPHVSTRLTTYLQSDFKRWADSRAYVEWIWDVSITEKVAFEWNLGVRWDGEPHANLNAWDLGSTMGLRFGFNGN
ncbi:DUF481 domain-containing protein [Flavobacteriales bacterium]|nr:DUF481 domain-containing protein [Flavobacteriales bacterium]